MSMISQDDRLFRRYNSARRRGMSLFLLLTVLPSFTGLDVAAQEYVADANRQYAEERYDHQHLCATAPQYLQGNLIPRLQRLATWASSPTLSAVDRTNRQADVDQLALDLKRLQLAVLDRKKESLKFETGSSSRDQLPTAASASFSSVSTPPLSISPLQSLQSLCQQCLSDDDQRRQEAAAKILHLLKSLQTKPVQLPSKEERKSKFEIGNSSPNRLAASPTSSSPISNFQLPISSPPLSIINYSLSISSSPSTILSLSRVPHPPVQLAAVGDVLAGLLAEVTDPASSGPPTALDVVITPPLLSASAAVQQLATDLQTPVRIFEHFRNTVVYEPYFGAVKGAAKTLDEQAGNDVDIASALISVYRAAGIPCRYVYGTIRLTAEQAASWLGVDAAQVDALLQDNRIPYRWLSTPGAGELLVDHVWVKAYIDYLPYRGATDVPTPANGDLHTRGDAWIEIDPSFKQHAFTERRDVEAELGLQTTAFLANIRGQSQLAPLPDHAGLSNGTGSTASDDNATTLPQVFILNEVIGLANPLAQFLAQNHLTTETVFRERVIVDETTGLLPCTDFYAIHARGASYAVFPEALASRVTVTLSNSAGRETLRYTNFLAALLDGNLQLSWIPATAADTAAVQQWNADPGDPVPAYQVNVIPQLRLDGVVVDAGVFMDTAGAVSTLTWSFYPGGSDPSLFPTADAAAVHHGQDTINAGAVSAFVFDAGIVTDAQIAAIRDDLNNVGGATTPRPALDQLSLLLRAAGLNYFYQADRFSRITAGVLDLYARRAPSLVRVSYGLEVDAYFNLPFTATANTVKTAVIRDAFAVTPISSNFEFQLSNLKSYFTYVNALSSSALSANNLQQLFNADALSPARLLQAASNATVPVYTLTPATDDLGQPTTPIDVTVFDNLFPSIMPATQDLIVDMLNRGWSVTFPRDPVVHGGLSRDPIIAVDPRTGDSGFFLFAPGYRGHLVAGAEVLLSSPPFTLRDLLLPATSNQQLDTIIASVTDWLYALPDATVNTGIAFLPAIAHIKNFLSDTQSEISNLKSQIRLSSLTTVSSCIALIGRIDEISRQPGIVNLVADPALISPNNDGIQDTLAIHAVATRTASWTIQFSNSSGVVVRDLTPADNLAPDTNNPTRINVAWDGRDNNGIAVPDGRYQYVVTALGAGGATFSGSVTVDRTLPTATIAMLVESTPEQDVFLFKGTATDVTLQEYTVVIRDVALDEPILTLFTGNLSVNNGDFGGLSEFALPNGSYFAHLTVTDKAGNVSTAQTSAFTVTHPVIDATPPEVTVLTPLTDPNAEVHQGLAPISVSAFDSSGIVLIQILIDGLVFAQASDQSTLDFALDLSFIDDGVHTLSVLVIDGGGNQKLTDPVTFLSSRFAPDTQPPALTFDLPDTSQTPSVSTPVTVTATDNDALEIIILRVDTAAVASQPVSGAAATASLTHLLSPSIFDGTHTVTAYAADVSGNFIEQSILVSAATDPIPPDISMQTSVDDVTGDYRGDVNVRVTASDNSALRQILVYLDGILVDRVTSPILNPQSAIANLQSQIPASDLLDGTHTIFARAIDAAGNARDTTTVTFSSYNPIANFRVTPAVIRPGLPTGTILTVSATLQQNTPWTIAIQGPSVVPDVTGTARQIFAAIDVASFTDGEYTLTLTVEDKPERPSATFVIDLVTGPPVAAIANIVDGQTIQDGLFDLLGTADDPDSTDSVSYKVVLFKPDGSAAGEVTPQPVNAQGFHEGRVSAGESLGDLDFTLTENGVYDLQLIVKGGFTIRTAERRITLDSQLKVGQFSFSQQDLLIPVGGQPLSVIRTYNSLNKDSGDFGYSWTWAIADVEMELDEERDYVEDADGVIFSQRVGGGRNVSVTLPDGRHATFQFSLKRFGNFMHQALWTAPPGVRATLRPTVSNKLVTLFFGLQYWEASGPDTPWEVYDFPGFILTMPDGTEYLVEREDTDFHFVFDEEGNSYSVQTYGDATLREIKQRAGDRIELLGDRIDYFNASSDTKTKSIVFDRDTQNRIIAVYDPKNLDANDNPVGPAVYTYEYDGAGNLYRVNRLVDDTNAASPVYETTTFVYGLAQFPHYITAIQDPRGVTPMRNEYDDSGRLIAVIDANGNRIDLEHNLTDKTETIYDREGNPTLHAYDTRGNVLSTTDPLGNTTQRTYDADDNETSVTDPLGNTTFFMYDADDNRTSVTDPLGNATNFTYDPFGNQLTVTDPLGNVTRNEYDSSGNLIATVNALGQRTVNTYDANGNLTATRDARGNVTAAFAYDGTGNLTSTADAFGFARSFSYDSNGNQTGASYQWVNPNDAADIRTVTTQTIYDAAGQVVRTVDPEGNGSVTLYNEIGKPVETTDKLGNTTTTVYDARGNVIESRFSDDTRTRTVYDKNGRAVVTTDRHDPNSADPVNGSRTLYDAAGRVIRSERLADVAIDLVTDANNQPATRFAGAAGVISSASSVYDAAGRVLESINVDGEVTRFEYDAAGRQTAVIDTLGHRTEFQYDATGRQTLVRDTVGRETQFEYDSLGRRIKTTFVVGSPEPLSTTTSYNDLGQRIAETDQSGLTRQFEYDLLGRLIAVILPEVPDPENNNVLVHPRYEYDYDDYGHLSVIRDPKGRETHFTYDELGRQVTRTLPLGQTESQTYNNLGQLHTKVDFKGQIAEFVHDQLGRVQDKKLFENQSAFDSQTPNERISFAYDTLGRQSQISESSAGIPAGITSFSYDPDGRLVSISSPEGTIFYEYDSVTGRKDRTFTANSDVLYDYDELGRLGVVTVLRQNGIVLSTPEVTTYEYNDVGTRAAVDYPNNTRTEYTYDSLNRLTDLVNVDLSVGGATTPRLLSSYSYSLSPNGRRTAVTETRLESDDTYSTTGIQWTYDGLNRLIREASGSTLSDANYTTDYVYDLVGNRLSKSSNVTDNVGGATTPRLESFSYQYNSNDQLLEESFSSNVGGAATPRLSSYSYDLNGSLISKVETDQSGTGVPPVISSASYSYSLDNRLSSAEISRTETVNGLSHQLAIATSYLYNQSGIRVRSNSATSIDSGAGLNKDTVFLLDSNNHTGYAQVLEEYSPTSATAPSVSNMIGDDIISQSTISNLQSGISNVSSYLMYDGHGSTRLLTSSSGTITDRYSFDAYGVLLGGNPSTLQPSASSLLYSGEQFDIDLQQQYLRARYYDQSAGRFNRLDPFNGTIDDPQTLHKYAYAHNDPINATDPSGTELLSILAGIGISQSIRSIYDESVLTVGGVIQASLEGVRAGKSAEEILFETAIFSVIAVTGVIAFGTVVRALSAKASKGTVINRTAEHANAPYIALGKKLPYRPGTPVVDMVTAKKTKVVRVFTDGVSSPAGRWMTTIDQIDGLHPQQIKDFLALEHVPTHIVQVVIPAGTKIRTGMTSAIYGNRGGATQIELLQKIPDEFFGVPKPL